MRDGCFFIDEVGQDDPLLFVPYEYGLYFDDEGYLAFRSRYLARAGRFPDLRVGEGAQLGMRYDLPPRDVPAELRRRCGDHRVVTVTSLGSVVSHGINKAEIRRFRDRHKLTDGHAIDSYHKRWADHARVDRARRLDGSKEEYPSCWEFHLKPPRKARASSPTPEARSSSNVAA